MTCPSDERSLTVAPDIPALSAGCFRATLTGLEVVGEPSVQDWLAYGEGLRRLGKAAVWCLADWLNYGQRAYGEAYSQALSETDYKLSTLKALKYVAHNIAPAQRSAHVPFSHHREVASLPAYDQREWLEKAAEGQWSRDHLRAEIKADKRRKATGEEAAYSEYLVKASVHVRIVVEDGHDVERVFKQAMRGARFPFYENNFDVTFVYVADVLAVE